jgi:hypothetical protein
MLYEIFWLVFALSVGILMSVGLLGLIFSPSIPTKSIKAVAMILSILILLAGIYFSYRWNAEKKGIQTLTGQIEQTIKTYLEKSKKDS